MLTGEHLTGQLKQLAKRGMYTLAPTVAMSVMSSRARAHSHRLVREWGLIDLNRKLIGRLGTRVLTSPFRGMTLSPMTYQEHLGPFLLGTYERELHPWFERAIASQFRSVLDVGSKFGYYAVGLALRMRETEVIAFDTDSWARTATREMALANNTPRLRVEGACSPRWMNRNLGENSFIVSDCEGYEGELFLKARTSALDSATLLIEVHDQTVPGVGAAIRGRFRATHTIESVQSQDKHDVEIDLSFLSREEAASAVREIRGPQEWLLITPRVESGFANSDSQLE
jgi:hypothetical protein